MKPTYSPTKLYILKCLPIIHAKTITKFLIMWIIYYVLKKFAHFLTNIQINGITPVSPGQYSWPHYKLVKVLYCIYWKHDSYCCLVGIEWRADSEIGRQTISCLWAVLSAILSTRLSVIWRCGSVCRKYDVSGVNPMVSIYRNCFRQIPYSFFTKKNDFNIKLKD